MDRCVTGAKPETKAGRLWLKRVGTWLVALALLSYVFYRVPFARAWEATLAASPVTVVLVILVYSCFNYAADVLATWATFRWFCVTLRLREVALIRGATYLLALVNYNLGQGGIVYLVGKTRGVGVARATGTVLLTMGVMFVALLLLAGAGSALGDPQDRRLQLMRWIAGGGLLAFVAYLIVIAKRPAFLARRDLLKPLFDAGVLGHLKALAVRFPHIAGHVFFQWVLLRLFHVDLPLSAAATLLPVVFVIAWIPITVQGLGTQQVAALELLSCYATAPTLEGRNGQVIAFSLSLSAVSILFCVLVALLCLRRATALDTGSGAEC